MSIRPPGKESLLPWVEGVARHIGDPVARLRFLRAAAPHARPGTPATRRRTFMLLLELTLVVFLILAFTMAWVRFVKPPVGPKSPLPGITPYGRAVRNPAR